MNKKTIITLLLAIVTLTGWAKEKVQVWESPTIEYGTCNGDGYFNLALDVTKVELKDTETVMYITARQIPGTVRKDYWFQFAGDTYLKVGDQRYTLISADGIELNKHLQTGKDGKLNMAFHFPPLPKGTKVFDFIEGDGEGAFQILGIKPVEERWKQMLPSYWRDEQGDWKIAFLDDCAIYDCKFWDYKQRNINPKTGEAQMLLTNGNDELKVTVGKDKKGTRMIQIANQKKVYSMITSRDLPDYPTKDTRTDFVNSGYRTDTITLVGWLKDMPEHYKSRKSFEISYVNFFTPMEESVNADLDSLGRFTAKIPVLNSTEFYLDWGRSFITTVLEPRKTYFMLCDFKEGRRYFMGDDCRLQNEQFKHIYNWHSQNVAFLGDSGFAEVSKRLDAGNATPELFDEYIAVMDSMLKEMNANNDALFEAHPTLSTRFSRYMKGDIRWSMGRDLGQARFNTTQHQLPENALKYAYDTFWTKIEEPVTLFHDMSTFLRDYLDEVSRTFHHTKYTLEILDFIDEYASNDEELDLLKRWKELLTDAEARANAAPTPEEKQKMEDKLYADNADMLKEVNKILNTPKSLKVLYSKGLITRLKNYHWMLDSLGAVPFIKDMYLTKEVYDVIDHHRTSQPAEVIDTLKALVSNPEFIAMVEKLNDHYLAIENREFDKLVLKSSDNLADLSEGEALLKKILEPYKGKFVLLDIWGTWCGPCKEALSHSTEEYERLKDYDIEFLYLANRSPQESWENVIKEYNVSGPNVSHYNLPAEQQTAIERFLKVHSFPTYKLFNRNGDLLDLNVDARDLEGLVQLLEKL